MELYILSKADLSILSIAKLSNYELNLDEETNAKSTFTVIKTEGLKKDNFLVLNGLYKQFLFIIDDVEIDKGSDLVTVTALDISNIFDRKVIERNADTMISQSIEDFIYNNIQDNFVNSDDEKLNIDYIEIFKKTTTQARVDTNSENGLYNFHTYLINCRQYKNIYTDFSIENLGQPQTVQGKSLDIEAKNRKIDFIKLEGETSQATRSGRNLYNYKDTTNINPVITVDKDGWITGTYDNSSSSSTVFLNFFTHNLNLDANTNYTVITEIKNVSGTGTLQVSSSSSSYGQFSTQASYILNSLLAGDTKKNIIKTKASGETITDGLRTYIRLAAGQSGSITFRLSVLADTEIRVDDFEYEPYGVMPSPEFPSPIVNVEGRNKFNIQTKSNNYGLRWVYGDLFSDNKSIASDYIDVTAISSLYSNYKFYIFFYDNSKNYIGNSDDLRTTNGTSYSSNPIDLQSVKTLNSNVKYCRLWYRSSTNNSEDMTAKTDIILTQTQSELAPYVPYDNIEVKVEGKNLLNYKNPSIKSEYTNTTIENDIVTMEATSTTGAQATRYDLSGFDVNKTYTASCIGKKIVAGTDGSPNIRLAIYGSNDNTSYTNLGSHTISSPVVGQEYNLAKTVTGYSYYRVYVYNNSSTPVTIGEKSEYRNIMFEQGITATQYEPYKSQTAFFPLEGKKLMEGSYLADDGIHNTHKQIVLDGTETISDSGSNVTTHHWTIKPNDKKPGTTNMLSNQFQTSTISTEPNTIVGNASNTNLTFKMPVSYSTVQLFRSFLTEKYEDETPVIVEYELAEEEIIPYTIEQQQAWDNIKNLTLYEGINHISSDANMIFKYYPLNPIGTKLIMKINIENKVETTEMIDTTLPEVTDYNKVYEEDVTAKVTVLIREDNSTYTLYLKTDRTTTTNKNDPNRANGKIEVISVDTADKAPEEALNVMKGNNYKHLVEFKIAKTSKLMDISKFTIGRPVLIKTDDDIYESYISAITLSDENFVYFKSGSLRVTLLDKLKSNNNNVGNKLDVSGGTIKGNLDVNGDIYQNGKNKIINNDYLITEKEIGTWIDGKPLYRKVIYIQEFPNASNVDYNHNINNVDVIVHAYGYGTRADGTMFTLPFINVTQTARTHDIGLFATKTTITLSTGIDRRNLSGYVIVEYTKNTD